MKKIAVFGAGGRAGRAVTAEAVKRGHHVTAVVRDPSRYPEFTTVKGDITDAETVQRLAEGQDALVHAAADLTALPGVFFPSAAKAFANTDSRIVVIGLASVLETAEGVLLMDTPGYPQEWRSFYEGHKAGLDTFRDSALDWVALSPAGDFSANTAGKYRVAKAHPESRISYADFAIAVLDEIDNPTYRRVHLGVEAIG